LNAEFERGDADTRIEDGCGRRSPHAAGKACLSVVGPLFPEEALLVFLDDLKKYAWEIHPVKWSANSDDVTSDEEATDSPSDSSNFNTWALEAGREFYHK